MLSMIGKRLMFAIPSLIGVVIVTFLLTRALPGDPAAYFAGPAATKEAIEQIRKKLGLTSDEVPGRADVARRKGSRSPAARPAKTRRRTARGPRGRSQA